ncbi:MAG: VOC family protein [Proteobacteria bacterium]|nr:VOC family protein [Pseudomonadota bacterium]
MPSLEHVALWVSDLDAMCAFYAQHFGARAGPRYENPRKGFASRFVAFEQGGRLELMTSSTLAPVVHEPGAQRMGLTHLAIALGSEAAVDALTARLQAAGTPVLDGPRRTGDGYYESVVLDPEGNRIELTA